MNSENPLPEIFINGRFLTQRITGVQAFAHSICDELTEAGIPFKFLVPSGDLNLQIQHQAEVIKVGNLSGHLWEQIQLKSYMKNRPGSVLVNLCNTAPMGLTNQVVTIHDLAFHHHPEWFSMKFRIWYNFMIPRVVKSASGILTVSHTSANEIKKSYGVSSQKIFVTGNKVTRSFLEAGNEAGIADSIGGKRFFLMVGSNDPRKNFDTAGSFISDFPEDVVLVVAGGNHQSFAKISPVSSERIIRTGYVSTGELKWLYQNAIALINPSRYEGFGIPNLEAMSQNCPVICSDIPVFREVCREAAFYFNPDDTESLKNQAKEVLNYPEPVSSKKMIGNSIFTSYQNTDRTAVILKAISR